MQSGTPHRFPFGIPLRPTPPARPASAPAAFVIGVHAGAVHARWVGPDGRDRCRAIPVAPEPHAFWRGEDAAEIVGAIAASLVAYFCGEFCNSYVLAKMKLRTEGRLLWTRTIGSTIVGEAVDSAVFYPVAFLGVWSHQLVLQEEYARAEVPGNTSMPATIARPPPTDLNAR